jgi:hypothetical protein
VRFAARLAPAPASEGRALTPAAVGRVVLVEEGDVTEPRAGAAALLPDVTRAAGFAVAAPPMDIRAVDEAKGLADVEDMEGLLPCPNAGATDVRRAAVVSAPALAPAAARDLGTVAVEAERGDFFTAGAGPADVDFVSEVLDEMNHAADSSDIQTFRQHSNKLFLKLNIPF